MSPCFTLNLGPDASPNGVYQTLTSNGNIDDWKLRMYDQGDICTQRGGENVISRTSDGKCLSGRLVKLFGGSLGCRVGTYVSGTRGEEESGLPATASLALLHPVADTTITNRHPENARLPCFQDYRHDCNQ